MNGEEINNMWIKCMGDLGLHFWKSVEVWGFQPMEGSSVLKPLQKKSDSLKKTCPKWNEKC